MKKMIATALSLLMVLSLAGCGDKQMPHGDTTIQIDEIVYYNTLEAIPVEPAESAIVYPEPPENSSSSNDVITAYAFINEDTIEGKMLVGLVKGEWYKFMPKHITAETPDFRAAE